MKHFDPTTLEIYRALFTSVAEEMGIALRRTAFSPNIKERRDYSCAVFDAKGQVIAQGDHMPVHLGSMPMAVAAALKEIEIQPGDVIALNDPFAGGTHLPDVTLVAGVFVETSGNGRRRDGTRGRRGDRRGSELFGPKHELGPSPHPPVTPVTPSPRLVPYSSSPTGRITRISAVRRRARWGWLQTFTARAFAFLQFDSYVMEWLMQTQ
jgi:hypothetical protein